MQWKYLKSDLPTGRYDDEVIRTQSTLWLLDDSYGFHVMIVFTYGGKVKNATEKVEIRPSHREIHR